MMPSSQPSYQALAKLESGVALVRMPRRALAAHELRLSPLRVGLCRTDLFVARGLIGSATPRVLGHEVVARVLELGTQVENVSVGELVCVYPLLRCLHCEACKKQASCTQPLMLGVDCDGALAEELVVPHEVVHAVPEGLSLERAAYVEPVAATLSVLHVGLSRAARGVVVGSGRIAELTRRVLTVHGFCNFDVLPAAETPQLSYAFSIDTQGSAHSLHAALHALLPGGTLVLKSRPAQPVLFDVALAVRRELNLRTANYAPFADAIALLSRSDFEVDDLLGSVLPIAAFEAAFQEAERSEARKLFLAPQAAAPLTREPR